jgi:hypothetical protein
MNRFNRFFPLAAVALVFLAPALRAASLVSNGDFAKPNARGDWPAGWGSYAPDNGVTWETADDHRFLRLVTQTPGQLQMIGKSISLPADVNALTVTVRYHASSVQPGAQPDNETCVLFYFRDSFGRILPVSTPPLSLPETSARWSEASCRFSIPADASRLTFLTGLYRAAAGTLDLAEIDVSPDPSVTSRLPSPARPAGPSLLPAPDDKLPSGQSLIDEDGLHFLRLVSEEPGQMQMFTRLVPVTPGLHGVEIVARFRTVGVNFGEHEWNDTRTIVQFLDADDRPIANSSGSLDLVFGHKPAPTGWRKIVRTCRVPPGAVQLRLMTGLFQAASGTVDLADLSVTPVDDDALARLDIVGAISARENAEGVAERERMMDEELSARLAATGNLTPNGGFETEGNPPGWPAGWGKKKPDDHLSWMEESGDHFMRLTTAPGKTVMLYHMFPLPTGTRALDIRIRYRVTDLQPGASPANDARAILHFLNGQRFGHLEYGHQYAPDPDNIVFAPADGDWHDLQVRVAVPEGATKLQFMPALWNTRGGTLDLSDILVTPVADATER